VLGEPRNRQGVKLSVGTAGMEGVARAAPHDDQATVRPPFDPVEFARQSELSTVPPPGQVPDLDPVISSETTLEVLFVDGETIPALAVAREDLEWFDLAPAVRALLRHVDGEAPVSDVCARVGQTLDDGIMLVEQLVRDGLIVCR
jgi:hypothetical protein